MKTIGFIGLGNMGKGMSINLAREKMDVVGYDINRSTYEKLKTQNIELANSVERLVKVSDIIITMLPDGLAVKNVWSEVIGFSRQGQYLIDCSTIDVKTSRLVQIQAKEKGLFTLDAPVSGGVIGADEGTLTFMVGGKSEIYNEMK